MCGFYWDSGINLLSFFCTLFPHWRYIAWAHILHHSAMRQVLLGELIGWIITYYNHNTPTMNELVLTGSDKINNYLA